MAGEETPMESFHDKQVYYPSKNIKSTFGNNYNIVFGHRRFSIVDLTLHGHQPMSDESRRYWIVFNGEVYNFKEIRKELIDLGHNFLSDTDTEVILRSFIQWQEQCLQKFNGDFVFLFMIQKKMKYF